MKKYFLTLSAMMFMSLAFIACGGDDDADDGVGGGETGGVEVPAGKVDPIKEKQYIESVAREFVNLFKATDYQDLANLFDELEDSDGDGIFEDFVKTTQTGNFSKEEVLVLANIKGSFEASYGKEWKQTSTSGDLTCTYTASDGKKWVLSVAHSGNLGKVLISEDYDWEYVGYYDWREIVMSSYLEVPKTVKATLKKSGETVSEVNLNIGNFAITGDEIVDISKMSYTLTAKLKDMNVTSEASYVQGSAASVKATVKKGSKTLVEVTADGNTSMSKGEINGGNVNNVNCCILSKLNVKGSIKNISSLIDAMDNAYDNDDIESSFDRWLTNANSYIDLGLYNNNSTKQADIIIGKDTDKRYDYNKYVTYFRMVPMFKFSDGTSYSFEEYFDETTFQGVTDAFDRVIREFNNLVK